MLKAEKKLRLFAVSECMFYCRKQKLKFSNFFSSQQRSLMHFQFVIHFMFSLKIIIDFLWALLCGSTHLGDVNVKKKLSQNRSDGGK
jgi:hypothetical protein